MKRTIHIHAPVAAVFSFFSDPTNLPWVWPNLLEVSRVAQNSHECTFDWTYKMAGTRVRGRALMTKLIPNALIDTQSMVGVASETVFRFAQDDDGVRVTAQVEYEIPEAILRRLPAAAVTRITERDLVLALENAKFTIEASLPQRAGCEDALRTA